MKKIVKEKKVSNICWKITTKEKKQLLAGLQWQKYITTKFSSKAVLEYISVKFSPAFLPPGISDKMKKSNFASKHLKWRYLTF